MLATCLLSATWGLSVLGQWFPAFSSLQYRCIVQGSPTGGIQFMVLILPMGLSPDQVPMEYGSYPVPQILQVALVPYAELLWPCPQGPNSALHTLPCHLASGAWKFGSWGEVAAFSVTALPDPWGILQAGWHNSMGQILSTGCKLSTTILGTEHTPTVLFLFL